jgi:hypothetical protein
MAIEKVLIETQSWYYTCGDGCCYDYGVNLFINGNSVSVGSNEVDVTAIMSVLTELGIESVHEYRENESFDARMPELDDDGFEDFEDEDE